MALELTKEQEDALVTLADWEIAQGPLIKALEDAQAALDDVNVRVMAELQSVEDAAREQKAAIDVAYAEERSAALIVLNDARAQLDLIATKPIVLGGEAYWLSGTPK